jgi:hypothetical protein
MEHSREIAEKLVKWLYKNRPDMFKACEEEFQRKLLENILEQDT